MKRLTKYDNSAKYYLPFSLIGDYDGKIINKLGELEDVFEKYNIKSIEDLELRLEDIEHYAYQENQQLVDILAKYGIENLDILDLYLQFIKNINIQNANLRNELAELKQKAIVLPFEFDKPIYKLCPKCNDRQTNCKNCAWGGCGFNQCYNICHKENKGQIICEITFEKDNCNVSWNALRFISEHWGEYYFATREEAEQKLAEIRGKR